MFEIVNRRTHTHGRRLESHPISSPCEPSGKCEDGIQMLNCFSIMQYKIEWTTEGDYGHSLTDFLLKLAEYGNALYNFQMITLDIREK